MDNQDAPNKVLHPLDDAEMDTAERLKLHRNDEHEFTADNYADHLRHPDALDLGAMTYTCAFCQQRFTGHPIDAMKIIQAHYEATKTAKRFEQERARAAAATTTTALVSADMSDDDYEDDCDEDANQELPWEFRCMKLPFHTCQPSHWVAAALLYVGEQSPIGVMIRDTLPRFLPAVQGGEVLERYNSLQPTAEAVRQARMQESVLSANQHYFDDPPPSIPVTIAFTSSSAAAAGCGYPDDDDEEGQMEQ